MKPDRPDNVPKCVAVLVVFFAVFAPLLWASTARAQDGWGVSMVVCPLCAQGQGHVAVVPFDTYERCDSAKQAMEISNRFAWVVCLNGSDAEIEAAMARARAPHCREITANPRLGTTLPKTFDECMAVLKAP